MGKRRENRIVVSMPVRVSGIDAYGNAFSQTAQTIDVSRTGARLSGVRCLHSVGEMITIECGPNSARFMVVWIGQPGSSEDGLFGVKALQPEKRIFRVDTGETRPDKYVSPADETCEIPKIVEAHKGQWDHSERRGSRRMACSGTGQVKQPGVAFPVWATIADLSMGGCYLEMVFTMPQDTPVEVKLTISSRTFAANGTVVTSHPGVGVGINFNSITPENLAVLSEIVRELTERRGGVLPKKDFIPPSTP
ncbi:MAG: PilZ domain-containing protein [Acidobacteriaceae bacterium]